MRFSVTTLPGKILLDKIIEILLFAWNLKEKSAGGRSPGTLVSPEVSRGLEDLAVTDYSGKKHSICSAEDSWLRDE